MKCKHMHKDSPENAICEDCGFSKGSHENPLYAKHKDKLSEVPCIRFKQMKGGNNHGRK